MTDDRIRLAVVPGPFAGPLVSRVVGIAAARADLPLERIDDALLIADAIAARAPAHLDGTGERLRLDVGTRPGGIELGVGPLRDGAAERLLEESPVPHLENVFRRVATRALSTRDASGSERLVVEISHDDAG